MIFYFIFWVQGMGDSDGKGVMNDIQCINTNVDVVLKKMRKMLFSEDRVP